MKITVAFPLLLAMLAHGASGESGQPGKAADVLGTWEGESICMVVNSPCHNEHVIYEIGNGEAGKFKADAFKVVSGKREFMGTLPCQLHKQILSCTFRGYQNDDWEFTVTENSMNGKLWLGPERTLFREIRVTRQANRH